MFYVEIVFEKFDAFKEFDVFDMKSKMVSKDRVATVGTVVFSCEVLLGGKKYEKVEL